MTLKRSSKIAVFLTGFLLFMSFSAGAAEQLKIDSLEYHLTPSDSGVFSVQQGISLVAKVVFSGVTEVRKITISLTNGDQVIEQCSTEKVIVSSAMPGKLIGICNIHFEENALLGPRYPKIAIKTDSNNFEKRYFNVLSVIFNPKNCIRSDVYCLQDNSEGAPKIQQTIDQAKSGETIVLSNGSWKIDQTIQIDKPLSIVSRGSALLEAIKENVRIFDIKSSNVLLQSLLLSGVRLTQWGSGGAIVVGQLGLKKLTLDQVEVFGNRAHDGAALAAGDLKILLINRCHFSSNVAQGYAGAILLNGDSAFIISKSSFSYNTSMFYGAAIAAFSGKGESIIIDSLFRGNSTKSGGGAIHMWSRATSPIIIRYNRFIDNKSNYVGRSLSINTERSFITGYIEHNNFIQTRGTALGHSEIGLSANSSIGKFDGRIADNIFYADQNGEGTTTAFRCEYNLSKYPTITNNDIVMLNGNCPLSSANTKVQPMFSNSQYFELDSNSLLLGKASDGTNIGAWQGQ